MFVISQGSIFDFCNQKCPSSSHERNKHGYKLGECKALWGELERVSASSLHHWRWSLNPLSRSSGNWHTHAYFEDWRDATWRNSISIPSTCTRTWILDKACLNTGTGTVVGRHVRPRACWERQETRSDWMSCTLLKITGPYYCIVHRYECTHQCGPCDVHVHASWVLLEVEVDRVRDWKETRSDRTLKLTWTEQTWI